MRQVNRCPFTIKSSFQVHLFSCEHPIHFTYDVEICHKVTDTYLFGKLHMDTCIETFL